MSSIAFADRLEAARLAARRGGKRLRGAAVRPWDALQRLRRKPPARLVGAPRDLRTADPTVAWDIYAGWFSLAGKGVNAHGRSPFEVQPPSAAWAEELASFGWLRHLRAADTALARANARVLVEDWIGLHPKPDGDPAWRQAATCRRLSSWLAQSPLILQDADAAFQSRFMRALDRHATLLELRLREGLDGRARLNALVALALYGLCAADADAFARKFTGLLEREIDLQILADGGHIGRNPQTLVDLLLDFLPLRQIYIARGGELPARLFNGVDRMGPMLRLFRHGDGDLALFNGMGATPVEDVASVLSWGDNHAQPIMNAPASGYQRLEAGGRILIMDVGKPPPPLFSQDAHAGALAFEFSSRAQRLVINCGAPTGARADLRDAARATAAHSTLTIADMSSSRFARHAGLERWAPGQIVGGPAIVQSRRVDEPHAAMIEALHDGYDRLFQLVHRRRTRLFKNGRRLDGRDTLEQRRSDTAAADVDYAIRFHLHPNVQTSPGAHPGQIDLRLPDGQTWVFRCEDGAATLEESVFFASPHGVRPCRQIVLARQTGATRSVAWSFELVDETGYRPDDEPPAPQDSDFSGRANSD